MRPFSCHPIKHPYALVRSLQSLARNSLRIDGAAVREQQRTVFLRLGFQQVIQQYKYNGSRVLPQGTNDFFVPPPRGRNLPPL